MLASKPSYHASQVLSTSLTDQPEQRTSMNAMMHRRTPTVPAPSHTRTSPTDTHFSDTGDALASARNWSEDQVIGWLHSTNCAQYDKIFRKNNINGENLLEMDKAVLQEMGIDKIGDRVRLFVGIKKLRTRAYAQQKCRPRDSPSTLDILNSSASPSLSPRTLATMARAPPASAHSKRFSRQYNDFGPLTAVPESDDKASSRPASPLGPVDTRSTRQARTAAMSPAEYARREQGAGYFSGPSTSSSTTRHVMTAVDSYASQVTRMAGSHSRGAPSIDASIMSSLPMDQDMIRVISTNGQSKVFKITGCTSAEEVMRTTLRKFAYRETRDRDYCFYTLAGTDPDPSYCRKLSDGELWRVLQDPKRPERSRLILRKILAGPPTVVELERAAAIASDEHTPQRALLPRDDGPLSPASYQSNVSATERERNIYSTRKDLEGPASEEVQRRPPKRKGIMKQFFGARPPSELITSDLTTYFPDHPQEEIDKTARLSLRRSKRMSRVNSRLSVASNWSMSSGLSDAPPMPSIADTWLQTGVPGKPRALNLSRGQVVYRDSVASSLLEPLQEESPIEPNRKSYVSFDSGSDSAAVTLTDPSGNVVTSIGYLDDVGTDIDNSIRDISQALDNDGEEIDEELQSFLAGDSWDDSKWIKGALIGQGSFGSVYLALHAITGELLAVKQVEALSAGASNPNDAKKKSMIDALKREIQLLRDLQHPNIVQYLGSSSSNEYLNIFLEYVPGGSVQSMLNQYGALKEPLIRSFVRQIVDGLAYLHGRDIIHRDIKGANILVDNKGGIKISDFGISKKVEAANLLAPAGAAKNRVSLQGSVFWMAPEVVKQTSYTRKADIWSLGCLVIEMMTGNHPYPDCSQLQAIFKIGGAKSSPTVPEEASREAKAFLRSTFELEQERRPSSEELKSSPFLNPAL